MRRRDSSPATTLAGFVGQLRRIVPGRPTAMFGPATEPFVSDYRQHWTQPLVVGNGTSVDLPDLVEDTVSEFDIVVADREPGVGPSGSMTVPVTHLPIAALAGSIGSRMKITFS
jgi:hypothetical protein